MAFVDAVDLRFGFTSTYIYDSPVDWNRDWFSGCTKYYCI